jgi:hypothetical protein
VRLGGGGVVQGVEALVLDVGNGEQVGANAHPACRERLEGNAASDAQGCGEPPGEVPASGNILVAVPLLPCGEVGVARTRHLEEVVVVARACVGVLDDGGKGSPACGAVDVQAAYDAGAVLLAAGRGPAALAGRATCHEGSKGVLVNNDA